MCFSTSRIVGERKKTAHTQQQLTTDKNKHLGQISTQDNEKKGIFKVTYVKTLSKLVCKQK